MKRLVFLQLLVGFALLLFVGCKDCNPKELGTINLSQTDLSILPYVGSELIVFKDSVGDSICFKSNSGRKSYFMQWPEHSFEQNQCMPDFYYVESNEVKYDVVGTYGFLKIELYFNNGVSNIKKNIKITIAYNDSQDRSFICSYRFDALEISVSSYGDSGVALYNDSLMVGPNKLPDIYTMMHNYNPIGTGNQNKVYYNIIRGIVGFKSSDGHLWYLAN
jgi:hypothetical protein